MAEPADSQVMQALSAVITAAGISGLQVTRPGQAVGFGQYPYAHVAMGAKALIEEQGQITRRILMDVSISIGVSGNAGDDVESKLSTLHADIYTALIANQELGGGAWVNWRGTDDPEYNETEGQPRTLSIVSNWDVEFSHPWGDPYTLIGAP